MAQDRKNPVAAAIREGWSYDGHLTETLDPSETSASEASYDHDRFEYQQICVMLKREKGEES